MREIKSLVGWVIFPSLILIGLSATAGGATPLCPLVHSGHPTEALRERNRTDLLRKTPYGDFAIPYRLAKPEIIQNGMAIWGQPSLWESDRGGQYDLTSFIFRGPIDDKARSRDSLPAYSVPTDGSSSGALPERRRRGYPTERIVALIRGHLQRLYQSFASQGPERQVLVEVVKKQDEDPMEQARTVHFGIALEKNDDIMAFPDQGFRHIQIQVSRNAGERLHVEEQWGNIPRRYPGEVIGELGRYESVDPQSFDRALLKSFDPQLLKEVRYQLLHDALVWANHDAKLDRLFLQVNDGVRRHLESLGFPLEEANPRRERQVVEGKEVFDWVFEMDRALLLRTEARLLKSMLKITLSRYLSRPDSRDSLLKLRFLSGELDGFIKLGLIQAQSDRESPAAVSALVERNGGIVPLPSQDISSFPREAWTYPARIQGTSPLMKTVISSLGGRRMMSSTDPIFEIPVSARDHMLGFELYFSSQAAQASLDKLKNSSDP